jgi:hypothetical protein
MGFETVVRPVVFPNIRPAPPRVLPLAADPLQGMVVISGNSVLTVSESYSASVSVSRQVPQHEEVRQYDTLRVYQKTGAAGGTKTGEVNRSNYIDVEVLKKVRLASGDTPVKMIYAVPPQLDNVETIETDMTRRNDEGG